MTERNTSTTEPVTLAEVHRLLATTEFASVEDLVSQSELVDLREAPRPGTRPREARHIRGRRARRAVATPSSLITAPTGTPRRIWPPSPEEAL